MTFLKIHYRPYSRVLSEHVRLSRPINQAIGRTQIVTMESKAADRTKGLRASSVRRQVFVFFSRGPIYRSFQAFSCIWRNTIGSHVRGWRVARVMPRSLAQTLPRCQAHSLMSRVSCVLPNKHGGGGSSIIEAATCDLYLSTRIHTRNWLQGRTNKKERVQYITLSHAD